MKIVRLLAAALLAVVAADLPAQAPRELVGRVFHRGENDQEIEEKGVPVHLEPSGAATVTNGSGIFRLPLPAHLGPGDRVTLRVGKKDWRIRYPLGGELRIPADPLRHLEQIELLPAGSKLFWGSNARIENFISHSMHVAVLEANLKTAPFDPVPPKADPKRALDDWAKQNDVSLEEAEGALARWLSEVNASKASERQKGLAAYLDHELDKAADHFGLAGTESATELARIAGEEGDLASRKKAARFSAALNYESQGLILDLKGSSASIGSYEKALTYISPREEPLLWARINDHLGSALISRASRLNGIDTLFPLGRAVAAYEESLRTRAGYSPPVSWIDYAISMNILGSDPFPSISLGRLLTQARVLQTRAWQKCGYLSMRTVEAKSDVSALEELQEYSKCRSEIDALYVDLLTYRRRFGEPGYWELVTP